MNKKELLQNIKELVEQKIITKDEIDTAYNIGNQGAVLLKKKFEIVDILYYVGGTIVFLGIFILVGQNWSTLGFGTKLLATFGAGIVAYIVGILFSQDHRTETISTPFYLISALVLPIGLWVIFENIMEVGYGVQSLISGILLITYLFSYFVLRKNVFVLFSIIFGTWLFFSFTNFMAGSMPTFDWQFYAYRTLIVSVTYVLLGYSFSETKQSPLKGFLYLFGVFGFLVSALSLGEWEPHQNIFWELIYPVLVFGVLFLSVTLKSKIFLTWGALFLVAYIFKITAEYFSNNLGWPLALVVAGFLMIGVGYMFFSLKKKYLN
ncbi:MAG: DUF2157 domain-containing protein [Candidatus Paceibacterota bacterium]